MVAPSRIAVFRALQLGDMLCAVPAIRAIRHHAPDASLTLIGLPWAEELVERLPGYFDDFIPFPGYPGLPERTPDAAGLPVFFAAARRREFDLIIQMHGSGRITNPLVAGFGAKRTAGYYEPGGHCPGPETFMAYPEGLPEPERHLRLVEFLGVPRAGDELELPVGPTDWDDLPDEAFGLRRERYICLHPGARFPSRRWGAEGFAAVGDALAAEGYAIALTGTAAEAPLVRAVAEGMRAPALNLAGRTRLGSLAALVDGAALVVCNDTGMSHVAAARRTPSVVIASGSDSERWAPLDHMRHRVLAEPVPCRPCDYEECPVAGHPCATNVSVEDVLENAGRLLGTRPGAIFAAQGAAS